MQIASAPIAARPHAHPCGHRYNEALEVTETSIANIAVQGVDGQWTTPYDDCGLLRGTMRALLLRRGDVREGVITLEDLQDALAHKRHVVAFNSVRGVYRLSVEQGPHAVLELPQSRL